MDNHTLHTTSMPTDPPNPRPTSLERALKSTSLLRWLPGLTTLRQYSRATFSKDLGAGLVLTAMLAPVGMGYAEATGLSPIYGLYATIVPLLVYALFGPSRILVIGPDSVLAALIAATVLPLAAGDPERGASLAAMLALMGGAFCVLAGLARIGFITDLLSKPIRYGYLNGIALTLLVGQLPKILGFPIHSGTLLDALAELAQGVRAGQTNPVTLAIGLACLAVVFGCKRWLPHLPGVLLAVVGATLGVALFGLDQSAQLAVVGPLPQGLPGLNLPQASWDELSALLPTAIAIALVSIGDMSVLSRTYAARGKYRVDDNQEIIALGLANVGAGLFQGFSVSSSSSRTPVAEAAGARTQVTCVVGALGIALLLLVAPALMQHLPTAALGAVVIAACWSILEVQSVKRLYRLRREEFVLSMICLLGVALLGVVQGIFIAVAISLLAVIWRAWRPYMRCWHGCTASRATTMSRATPKANAYRAWCCSAGTRRCSSPMRKCFATASCVPSAAPRRPHAGWLPPPNRSPMWTPPPPMRWPNCRKPCSCKASRCVLPRSRDG
jgi:high affinity sulfate transporter 1